MAQTTIYLGMALSETPEWWRDLFQEHVRDALAQIPNVEVSKFVGLDKTTAPTDVYDYDIGLASKADLMVALTRFPSLGLGMEIQARSALKKPTILFHPSGEYLSKMPRGAPHTRTHYYSPHQTVELQAKQICVEVQDAFQLNKE